MACNTDYFASQAAAHLSHYQFMMNQYFETGRGIIFRLPANSPFGDFAADSDFRWSDRHKLIWSSTSQSPVSLNDLPASTILSTYTFHVPLIRTPNGDVRITQAEFERLERAPRAVASIWKLTADNAAVFPMRALHFTEEQKALYRAGMINPETAPKLSECLQLGDMASNMYGVSFVGGGGLRPAPVTVREMLQNNS